MKPAQFNSTLLLSVFAP